MKKRIVDKLTNFITKHKKCTEKDIKIYRYGLEALYNLATKTFVILVISYFLSTMKQCLLLILFYTSLRIFAYGLHANGSIGCWLTTIPVYIGGSLITKYYVIPKYFVFIIWSIYIIFVILWAPADTKKRPLIRAERRKKLKIESLIICLIHFIILLITNKTIIINCLAYTLALEAICICPLTYKITNNTFNNYLYYKRV